MHAVTHILNCQVHFLGKKPSSGSGDGAHDFFAGLIFELPDERVVISRGCCISKGDGTRYVVLGVAGKPGVVSNCDVD